MEHHRELPSFRLDGRLAVITGASEGIGRSLAVAFGLAGAPLALVSRDPRRLDDTIADLRRFDGQAVAYQADVRDREDLQRLAASVRAEQGPATLLVNSAGYPQTKPALQVSERDWDVVMDTGLKGLFFTCCAFAPAMIEQGYGKIINLSSTYAYGVAPDKSVYAIAKAAVSHLTRALAVEWAPHGVRVNALAPTLTATPTREQVIADEERLEAILARIPLGRYASPADLVGSALFLASEASDFVTGHTLSVDGGWTAAG